ncbi:unnamed protein product, partial [Cladocopium goreaui]
DTDFQQLLPQRATALLVPQAKSPGSLQHLGSTEWPWLRWFPAFQSDPFQATADLTLEFQTFCLALDGPNVSVNAQLVVQGGDPTADYLPHAPPLEEQAMRDHPTQLLGWDEVQLTFRQMYKAWKASQWQPNGRISGYQLKQNSPQSAEGSKRFPSQGPSPSLTLLKDGRVTFRTDGSPRKASKTFPSQGPSTTLLKEGSTRFPSQGPSPSLTLLKEGCKRFPSQGPSPSLTFLKGPSPNFTLLKVNVPCVKLTRPHALRDHPQEPVEQLLPHLPLWPGAMMRLADGPLQHNGDQVMTGTTTAFPLVTGAVVLCWIVSYTCVFLPSLSLNEHLATLLPIALDSGIGGTGLYQRKHFDFLAVIKRQCAGELLRAAADLQSALDEALHWRQNAALAVACACALILLALFGPWHAKQAKRGRSPTRRPAKSRKRAPRRPEVKPFCQHLWRGQVFLSLRFVGHGAAFRQAKLLRKYLRGYRVEAQIVNTSAGKSIGSNSAMTGETKKQLQEADFFVVLGTCTYGEKTKCKVSTHFEAKWWQENLVFQLWDIQLRVIDEPGGKVVSVNQRRQGNDRLQLNWDPDQSEVPSEVKSGILQRLLDQDHHATCPRKEGSYSLRPSLTLLKEGSKRFPSQGPSPSLTLLKEGSKRFPSQGPSPSLTLLKDGQ